MHDVRTVLDGLRLRLKFPTLPRLDDSSKPGVHAVCARGGKARPPVDAVNMCLHTVPSGCAMHDVHTVLDASRLRL